MNIKWFLSLTGLTGTLGAFSANLNGGERHTVKSRAVCGIPAHDYQSVKAVRGSEKANSFAGVPILPSNVEPNTKPEIVKLFQMNREKLVVDHCEITNVALTVSEGGGWSFAFEAHQNKKVTADKVINVQRPFLQQKQTSQILRNAFMVKARGLAQPPSGNGKVSALGGAVLWEIDLGKIMVENGEQGAKVITGQNASLGGYVKLTQQVEFFFTYE